MRLTLSVSLLVLFGCAAGLGAADAKPARHVEKEGGFSFVPPKDWELRDFKGLKYKIVVGPAANAFAPNINFVDEASKDTLKDYVAAQKKALKAFFKEFKEISEGEFKTADGTAAVRIVIENKQGENLLRQSFYLFDMPKGKKLVVTCSALARGGDKLDPVFKACLKSFKLEKKE
jgi:hypothetical protein